MLPRIAGAATAALLLSISSPLAAQFGPLPPGILVTAVTFTVPLNLTQLPPDLERVKVACAIFGEGIATGTSLNPLSPSPQDPSSESYPFKQELFVTAGQVVATASIQVVVFLDGQKAIGKTAQYGCGVMGYSKSLNRWELLSETPSSPVFMLKPAPPAIQGTFLWSVQ
jgi:hypothetical protein